MEIAVIGMACRYPGASTPLELFENVLAGRRQFREVPPERWRIEDYYDPDRAAPDRTYSKQAALLEGFEFKPADFRIPYSTFRATDTAQWLALTVARDALEDCRMSALPRARTAVILGNTLAGETSRASVMRLRWPYVARVVTELLEQFRIPEEQRPQVLRDIELRYKEPFPPVNEDNLAGSLANTIAGRICNYFDFHGGGFTVDGACSSSLLAIQQASQGLERGQYDLVVAGGVDISLDPFELVGFAKVGAISDTDIRVYDQRANGFLPGEGCGMVVLERLEDALKAKRRVYAIIRGVGCSSDGKGGITAPSVKGQSLALDRAYEDAGYSFADVELIEGHGTGTPVGDRTELQTFIDGQRRHGAEGRHRCGIGSVKSIIGHTKAAAGVAGFLKAALSVYHGVLPPTMGLNVPHALFKSSAHLYPLLRGRRWESDLPLRAAVSSAGFGGINTHVTLERLAGDPVRSETDLDVERLLQTHQDTEVFFFSAGNLQDLQAQIAQVAPFAHRISWAELLDLAADCARRAQIGPVRLGIVAQTPSQLHDRLQQVGLRLSKALQNPSVIDQSDLPEGVYLGRPNAAPRLGFLFPGQGSQRLNMGQRWRDRFASIKAHWDECDAAVDTQLREPLSDYVYPRDYSETHAERSRLGGVLKNTRLAQPALVAASMATADVLSYLGIEPQLVVGHSLGEYTALWQAGVLTKEQALQLAAQRGASMASAADDLEGGMLSVAAGPEEVKSLLASTDGYATIANLNAPDQTVVSGEMRTLEYLAAQCAKIGYSTTMLEVSGAFHSRLMEEAQQEMADVLKGTHFSARRLPLASTVTGGLITDLTSCADLLTSQIVGPVRFVEAMSAAQREGIDAFIEVGPGSVLSGLARRLRSAGILRAGTQVFATDGGSELEWEPWCRLLAYLFANGVPVDPQKVFEGRVYRAFKYPYEPRFIGSPCETPIQPLSLHLRVRSSFENEEAPAADVSTGTTPSEVTAEGGITAEGLFVFLRDFISKRFGYPADMVARTTRLGEDLGLDSIKSAEVLAEVLGHAKVHTEPARLVSLPLGETTAEIARMARDEPGDSGRSDAQEIWANEHWVRSFEVQMHACALTGEARTLSSAPVLLIERPGSAIAVGLVRELGDLGLECMVVSDPSELPELPQKIQGCVVVCPADCGASPLLMDAQGIDDQALALPRYLLEAIKTALGAGLGRAGERPFFALVTRSDGLGGRGESHGLWRQAPAATAMVKTLHLENPHILTRVLDFDARLSAEIVAERIVDELTCGDPFQDAGYTMSGLRYVPLLAPVPRLTLDVGSPLLSESDVVVVTGGAKGITARCIEELAAGSGARWALLGSSPAPPASDGGEGDDEISRTLAQFAAKGIRAKYYVCDVTRVDELISCVGTIERELGAITAIIHGAGLNVPRRLEALDAQQMQRVLGPKMLGLLYLLRALDLGRLRHITLLSSVIGYSGMSGNGDYAFANAWATQLLRHIEDIYPQVTCRAFAFSIWSDIGMGARLNSVASLGRIGVQAIAPADGTRLFADLMQRIWPNVELVVAGRLGELATARFLPSGRTNGSRWFEKVLLFQPGVEIVTQVQIKPDTDPYLKDHNYDGVLLLPAVVAMEAMAQVAAACTEPFDTKGAIPRLEGLKFERPIVVGTEGRTILIHALAEEPSAEGRVRVRVSVFAEIAGTPTECFSGYCVWGTASGTWGQGAPITSTPLPFDPAERLYGSIYFQGPVFQHIEAFYEVSDRSCLARVRISRQGAAASAAVPLLLDAWEVRDCFLHAIQICVPQLRLLPLSIDSLETRGYPGQSVYMSARERLQEGRDYLYDIEVFDEQGEVVECISGYRCRIVDNYRNKDVLAYIRRIHALSASVHAQAQLQAEGA